MTNRELFFSRLSDWSRGHLIIMAWLGLGRYVATERNGFAYERLQQGISLGSRAVGEIPSSNNPKTAKPN